MHRRSMFLGACAAFIAAPFTTMAKQPKAASLLPERSVVGKLGPELVEFDEAAPVAITGLITWYYDPVGNKMAGFINLETGEMKFGT